MPNIKPQVYKAKRFNTKAAIMIESLTGDGKTGLALELAYYLGGENWDAVGHIDTENQSANLYEGIKLSSGIKCEPFLKVDLTEEDGYAPTNYMACTDALIDAGAKVVIADSITHAWQRTGGVLDMVNQIEASGNKNKYTAWGDPLVVKNKNALFEMLRSNKVHMITTVRIKEKFGMDFDSGTGKTAVVSLGEQQQMQEGAKYEPDLVLHMIKPGSDSGTPPKAEVIKTRYPMLKKGEVYDFTPELMISIRQFLEEGADPEVLLKQQHEDYQNAIMDYCKGNRAAKAIYDTLKENKGYKDVKITDVPIKILKDIYTELTN